MSKTVTLELSLLQYLELEKIGLGAFAPLGGFMTEREFNSVVETLRLPNGAVFALPVLLDVSEELAKRMAVRDQVDLAFNGEAVGRLFPSGFFTCDRASAARRIYGTDDTSHPGVATFLAMRPAFVSGRVELSKRAAASGWHDELTPVGTRALFAEHGWRRVVGFQTRNVPHRAHEYLQRIALEYADGLFIQPLIGQRRAGDFTTEAVLKGYRALIGRFLPAERVVLGTLSTFMRFAGPREAVFHAMIRRNYGCTHFIVGRDHAGVGDYYDKYAAHDLVARFEGELGIDVLCLKGPYHCAVCNGIVTEQTCPHEETRPNAITHISGTDIRAMLEGGKSPEPHLIRPEIIGALDGVPLFVAEDEV